MSRFSYRRDTLIMAARSTPYARLLRSCLHSGVCVSLAVHAVAVVVLLLATVHSWRAARPLQGEMLSVTPGEQDTATTDEQAATVSIATEPADVTPQLVEAKLDRVMATAETQTAKQQLADLDKMTRRLNRLSSDESIEALAATFQEWFELNERANEPAEPATLDTFDAQTAQMHDIRRESSADGTVYYVVTLLDASGHTLEVQLTEAEGAPAYQLMERMKANPLLDQLYRQIAMPLLDQMINKSAVAEQHAAAAPPAGKHDSAAPVDRDPFVE